MASLESKSVQKLAQSLSSVPNAIEPLSHDEVVSYLAGLLQPFVAELESICKLRQNEILAPSTQQVCPFASRLCAILPRHVPLSLSLSYVHTA